MHIARVTCAHTISQMLCSGGISNKDGKITAITRISANYNCCKYRSHSAGTVRIHQVPFSGFYFDEQVPSHQICITVLFSTDLKTSRTALLGFPATLPEFQNFSTHFLYPCAHSALASFTRCRLNRQKLNTYRGTRPPS